ncbi:3'(2'),5'-bisphosphate nucleotidase CysQ [Sphingosinicella sp. LHD-64]|uniref:3'(2'),5'-bisphosphate nucleotidase CysQ n=1 Tax=Sphingosinicella sp. LHD-64 TaxID=3072139 RepID=UPI00280F6A9D|nr:3'(2'),5'-bisphosphate nucleotidase CysQ [Sphingosinicella sp. LHD-64]MDQ8757263.1 3'(2'),5'-bisphosphate nucleotidase CysQ [Sphingosinicella sp. LHD-64]
MTDEQLAAELAEEAGRHLLALRSTGGAEGKALGALADRAANDILLAGLARWRPDDPVLSEESADAPARLTRQRVWIIDPLDGTREYVEGRSDWGVHVALAVDGRPALGVVALPAQGRLFRSDKVQPPASPPRARPLILMSRTRPCGEAAACAEHLGADIADMGSAGAKAMAVVAGEADLYIHSGGQHQWDNCAPAAVALAAGLHATRLDGTPLVYNRPETLIPDLVIARPELGSRVVDFISSRTGTDGHFDAC